MSETPSAAKVLTDRNFGPYLVTNFISNIGNWFQNVAAGIVVFATTNSNTMVGMVSVLQYLGSLVLAPWSGGLADRLDRRKLLLTAQVISAVGAVGLAVWVGIAGVDGLPGVWPVMAASGIIGVGYAVGIASMNALIPALVGRSDLDQAIALNSATFTLARAVGPALAGVVVASLGAAAAFGLNSLTFLPLIVVLAFIRPREVERPSGDRSVRAGMRYLRSNPSMLWLIVATLAVGWSVDPANTLTPAYAAMFDRSEAFVGFQVAVFGAGAGASSLTMGWLRSQAPLLSITKLGLVLLTAGLAGVAIAPNEAIVLVAWFVTGIGFLFGITTTNSSLQQRLDEDMRGRVMAIWGMAFLGSRPLAALIDGAVADLFSPRIGIVAAMIPLGLGWYALGKVGRADHGAT